MNNNFITDEGMRVLAGYRPTTFVIDRVKDLFRCVGYNAVRSTFIQALT